MEKVLYLLWDEGAGSGDPGRNGLADRLLELGALGLQVNAADGTPSLFASPTAAAPSTVVGVWVDSAADRHRWPFDEVVAAGGQRWAAYLVTESEPLPNRDHRAAAGEPTPGLAQIALLRRPDGLDRQAWLKAWQDDHTPVAVATQATFRYVQNVVVRPLTAGAPPYEGIVEECFPDGADTDLHVFFDTGGDEGLLASRMKAMVDSCARFMDVERAEVFWTREAVFRPPQPGD